MTNTYKTNRKNSAFTNGIRMAVLAFTFLAFGLNSNAQVSTYTFAASAGTYTPISGGTVLGTPTNDDNIFANNPIGFQFCYNGSLYTEFGVNANGWIYMGNSIGSSSYNSLSTGFTNNVISAFNFDIQGEATTGDLQYKVLGSAPNRTLVVQWSNYDAYQSVLNTDVYNFQIRLSETTNQISNVYGSYTCNVAARTAQVGLRGASNADYNNISVSNGINTWATPIAGVTNASTGEINNTPLVPASGQTYTWSQPAAPAPPITLAFSAVTSTAMNLSWVDNSTNEATFYVYRSIDNITFTLVNTQASTSVATTGTTYNFAATSLFSNTLYYWRVFAGNANCGGTPLTGTQATLAGTMCGTYTIGPTGAYTSLTAAVAAVVTNGVNCPLIFEFQAAYLSTVETFPIVIPFLGNGPAATITARPELGATNLAITSAATQTIDFSGATYFSFDGRPGGVGVLSQLTIDNSSITGNAVRFINDAQNDGLNYMKVRGVTTSVATGIITFGNSITTGNNNNFITNSDITSGASSAAVLIYGSNTITTALNAGNNISNNNIYNWFNATAADAAISINGSSSAWSITNNSFYQTASRTYTIGVLHYGIFINSTTGTTGNFTVNGNFFGGSAANCGGSAWTDGGAVAHRFIALNVTTGSVGINNIQGNTIKNFNFTTSSTTSTTNGIWCGISLTGTSANMNVGTTTPNIIGSNSANGQIVTLTSGSGGATVGINSSASGNININGNQIGGITANSTLPTISSSINGIIISSGFPLITNNVIGSVTLGSSLVNAISNSITAGQITGINSSAFSGAVIITGNTVSNLTNQYGGTSITGYVRGIVSTSGINTISGNTIAALSNLAPQTGTTTTASVIGIGLQSTSTAILGNQRVFGNTIGGLANGSPSGNVQVNGILVTSSLTTGYTYKVYNNSIQSLGAPLTSGTPIIAGIQIYGGTGRVYNNMVVLGVDVLGNAITANQEYDGIFKNTANQSTIAFNSVSIAGNGVTAGTANTYGFRRANGPVAAPVDSLYSNIFSNTRSNGAGTGFHYGTQFNAVTGIVSNGNDFYGTGTGYQMGAIGVTNYNSVSAWTAATTFDANSFGVDPFFTSTLNLHINNPGQTPLESRAIPMGIVFDFDNQVRPGPTAINGGGTGPDIGADEFDGFPVNIDLGVQLLVSPLTVGCHTATERVRVRIKNNATTAINMAVNNVTVNGSVTGPNPVVFPTLTITSGVIAGGGTLDTTLLLNYNMTLPGTYVFNAATSQALDFVNSNDAMGAVSIFIGGGVTTVSPSSMCLGLATNLAVAGQTNGGTIQWQESVDNITWTNIVGATTTPYSITPTLDTTWYRAQVCGSYNSISDTARTIFVSPATTVGATRCGTGPVTLTAAGSGTLNWYNVPTNGSPINTGTTYSPTVSTTTTYYVENSTGTSNGIHQTTFAGGNGSAGNAFTVKALSTPITITSFDGNVNAGTYTWEIWYRPNDYLLSPGSQLSNVGWTQLAIVPGVVSAGAGLPTAIPAALSLVIPANTTYSFQIFTQTGSVIYTNGTALGALYNANADLEVYQGHGGTGFAGMVNNPRVFNGRIHYTAGCSSSRTSVVATVTAPPTITAVSGALQLCGNDTTLLTVSSSNTNYGYTWSPATMLNTTIGDSVLFMPTTPGNYTYYVDALDGASGCTNRDTVSITMNAIPTTTASVNTTPVCAGSTINLSASQPASTVQITNNNVLNTSTTYPAPYGNWYGGSRHQMLILASELTAAGLTSGNLAGMTFQVTNTNASAALTNFTISMGSTALTDLSAGFAAISATTVYTNPSYAPTVGANTHTFSTPFFWDGSSNIIVETCFANYTTFPNTTFTNNCTMRQTTTTFVSTAYNFYDNTANICGIASTATATQRPNIGFIRSFSSWSYNWLPTLNVANPTMQNTTATPTVTTNYIVTVTDALTGCNSSDSVNVVVNPTPSPMLGADTAICSNTALTLDGSTGTNYGYLWNNAATSQTIAVSAFGNYSVIVTDTVTGCAGRDTILVGINAAPAFSLGSDVTICAGNTASFSGPTGQFHYAWSTTEITQAITTGVAASYELVVTDTINACFNSDTIALFVNPLPIINLGSDTSICSVNAPYVLVATAGGYSYNWSDLSTNDSLLVNATGSYYVSVTDIATTCYSSDTVQVTINTSPVVSLGADSTFCSASGPIVLTATAGPFDYLWSDLSTGISLSTNTTGIYNVTITDSITGCNAMDTVSIIVNASPVVNLGADTMLCGGNVILDAQNAGANYMWNTTSTTQTITASTTGNYYVDVTSGAGCLATDSIMVTINTPPVVTFTPQANACSTDPAFTLVGSPAGGTFSGPGVTGNMFTPSAAGIGAHTVTYFYTDVNGCSGSVDAIINVNACVGVTEPFIAAGMNVFPNPNNGSFTLTINDANFTEITMEIVTIEGRVLMSDKVSNVKGAYVKQFNLSTEANGIYFLKVTANGQTYMQKVVKND